MAAVEVLSQALLVEGVTSLVLTPVTQAPGSGDFLREVRVFGPPLADGSPNLVLTVRLAADLSASLKVTTPALQV